MDAKEIQLGDWLRLRYKTYPSGTEVVRDFKVSQILKYAHSYLIWGEGFGNMGWIEKGLALEAPEGMYKTE
jgi:hypothetical protein